LQNNLTEKKKKSGTRKMQMNKEETPFCAITTGNH